MPSVHNYIANLGLRNIKVLTDKIEFVCPFCHPTKGSPNRRTAVIMGVNGDKPFFHCARCNEQLTPNNHFSNFIKILNYSAWQDYVSEQRKEKMDTFSLGDDRNLSKRKLVVEKSKTNNTDIADYRKWLKPLSELPETHEAVLYMKNRMIPESQYNRIFSFIGNPYQLFGKVFKTNSQYIEQSKRRIVKKGILVPFFNDEKRSVGFGIRMIDDGEKQRFINLILDGEQQFFFGEDKVNWNETVYVVEGMIDKITLQNDKQVISMISSNQKLDYIKKKAKGKVVYVYDIEYNNPSIIRSMEYVIDKDYDIFLAPHTMLCVEIGKDEKGNKKYLKDINDIRKKYKWSDKEIICFLEKHSYNGMDARLRLSMKIDEWKGRMVR